METTIHLNRTHDGAGTARAAVTEHYTSLDLREARNGDRTVPDVIVFLDAESALAVAEAAVSAYLGLTGVSHTEAFSAITGVWNDRRCGEVAASIAADHAANLESVR